jgi:nicotinate-nucleotide adenylyltransferase
MKIGLLFGTFNPIHMGHLVIAEYFAEFTDLDAVWIVVSPHNPLKSQKELLDDNLRLQLVKIAVNKRKKIKVTDVEFALPRPSYTYHTLIHLEKKFRKHQFVLIIGEDNLENFSKWKDFDKILDEFEVYTYPRPNSRKTKFHRYKNVTLFSDVPLMNISATFIRKSIARGKNVESMVPSKVWSFIRKAKLYKKK